MTEQERQTSDPLFDLPDLGSMDENEQAREVYARAGLALYQANVLEHGLVNFLVLLDCRG